MKTMKNDEFEPSQADENKKTKRKQSLSKVSYELRSCVVWLLN